MCPARCGHTRHAPGVVRSIALSLTMLLARSAHGGDQTVLGSLFQLKDWGTTEKRKLVVKAKEVASDNSIVGDPVVEGATLLVVAHGGRPSSDTFVLPSGTSALTGGPFWSGNLEKGFKYKDR